MRRGSGRDPSDTTYHWWETTRAEQDHVDVPLGRNWRIAGTVIGAVVVTILLVFVLVEDDDDAVDDFVDVPVRLEPPPASLDAPTIESVTVERDAATPALGRARVDGPDLVRVDIAGAALCEAAAGAGDAWIDVRFCADVDSLTITGRDGDGKVTRLVAEPIP